MKREYESTHPWLTFELDLRRLSNVSWMQLGEIISKTKHVANAPIDPKHASQMYDVFLAKGAAATAAIEGNTLAEEDVLKQIQGELELPQSQEYLQIETQNIIDACNGFVDELKEKDVSECQVTVPFILELHQKVLRNLEGELDEQTVPGRIRQHSVGVMGYRGAPSQDCHYLLDKMCQQIEEMLRETSDDAKYLYAILAALFCHIYIALIHPFGDGNGRTSRLLEVYILLRAGFPMPVCQLLSNHYNKTRNAYYKRLDGISKRNQLTEFLAYAIQGFVDGIREQVESIQAEQVRVTWVNYVHTTFADKTTVAAKRQRNLALSISKINEFRYIDDVLSSDMAMGRTYAPLADKTLTRDINTLVALGLISRSKKNKKRVAPNLGKITSFLPWSNNSTDAER